MAHERRNEGNYIRELYSVCMYTSVCLRVLVFANWKRTKTLCTFVF